MASIDNKDRFKQDDDDVFIVGDQRQRAKQSNLDYKNKKATQNIDDEEKKKQLILENSNFDKMKNFIGPCYLIAGFGGMLKGIYDGTRLITFKNRPTRLIATSMINFIGKNTSKYANAGACLCLLYSFVKQSTNYLFDDDMEGLNLVHKQLIYGFITGLIFKSTKGWSSAFFGGLIFSITCGSMQYLGENKYLPSFVPIMKH